MVKKINLFNRFEIKLTNKWLYSFIALGIVLILGIGVYALGVVPNPGHPISQLQTCDNGQILRTAFDGTWNCVDMPSGSGASLPSCEDNQIIKYNPNYCVAPVGYECPTGSSSEEWICADMPSGGSSLWSGTTDIYYNGGNVGIGTTNPSAKLDVKGATSISDSQSNTLTIINDGNENSNSLRTLYRGTETFSVNNKGDAKVSGDLDVTGRSTLNFCPIGYSLAFGEDDYTSEDSYGSWIINNDGPCLVDDTCNGNKESDYICSNGETTTCLDASHHGGGGEGGYCEKREVYCGGFTKKSVYCVSN